MLVTTIVVGPLQVNCHIIADETTGKAMIIDPGDEPDMILDAVKKRRGSWSDYERDFKALIAEREVEKRLDRASFDVPTVLLCSEPTPEHCHRRLVIEYLDHEWGGVKAVHL